MSPALIFLVLLSGVSLIGGKSLEDETCVGLQREDRSYNFDLPEAVTLNVQNDACDAEWTIDKIFTAVLDGSSISYTPPFKNVTRQGICVNYCPVSVWFHVTCPKYTRELACYCTNSTDNQPVFNTSLPHRDTSSSTKRQHYCAMAVAVTFVIVILAFSIYRANSSAKYAPRASADEQNQPG
ncbi:hypothetical protein R3I94_010128 [Phoxinus phoxinus]|uniref:Uncharacterized protein n=1 Tax=Phoxinus phoxinus TaxID=58324 RepID=A0AAN9D3L0_9TELE